MPFQKPTNRAEFDKFLSESEQTLVVYFSRSNPSCEKMASMLESLDQSHPGNRFVEIDTAKLKDVVEEYHIKTVPTVIVFQDGERIFEEHADASVDVIKEQLVVRFLDQ